MRTKREILDSTRLNALNSDGPHDIALIHSLHTLEVLIDIRDILNSLLKDIGTNLFDHAKES